MAGCNTFGSCVQWFEGANVRGLVREEQHVEWVVEDLPGVENERVSGYV